MGRIDLNLSVKLTPQNYGFDGGVEDFIALLKRLRQARGFDVDWNAQQEEELSPLHSVWGNPDEYRAILRKANAEKSDFFSVWATESSEPLVYSLRYRWKNWQPDHLSGEIYRPHPQYGTQTQLYTNLVEAVTTWKRPQHLAFGPMVYMRDHHPLDRARVGIRWMGWLPFDLAPSDVPEAELVRPMNGGTLVMTQSAFWQAWETNPAYSRAAIERAQEVEIRLNLLGVLPTNVELMRGDWGL